MIEIWDENGMVAYVDESERGSAVFGVPDKGPRECAGKKIPMVKHGKKNFTLIKIFIINIKQNIFLYKLYLTSNIKTKWKTKIEYHNKSLREIWIKSQN